MIQTAYLQWRARTGLGRAALAVQIGVSYGQLGRWLRADVTPRPEHLHALARTIGADPEAMLAEYLRADKTRDADLR